MSQYKLFIVFPFICIATIHVFQSDFGFSIAASTEKSYFISKQTV